MRKPVKTLDFMATGLDGRTGRGVVAGELSPGPPSPVCAALAGPGPRTDTATWSLPPA
jgi:hypothetical protein